MIVRALGLLALWTVLTGATPLPLAPPPPELAPLVELAAAPLDKPAVNVEVAVPLPPSDVPPLPLASLVLPVDAKPIAFVQPPRALPCVGAWTGVPSESLECGRARFQRNEMEEAAKALERATRAGTERDVMREARYWLGETFYRLGRVEQADWLFRQVAQEQPRTEWTVWALAGSGWTALRLGDAVRARDAFTALLAGAAPAPLEAWSRHGLGLANYALGRHAEAEQAWSTLVQRGVPAGLARDVVFWHGETLGRVGQHDRAVADLSRFVDAGAHPLRTTALLRRAWWMLAAGRAADAAPAFRAYLAAPAPPPAPGGSALTPEREWGRAGLALALLRAGDWKGARAVAGEMQADRSPLALPLLLQLSRGVIDAPTASDPDGVAQDLLALNLTPAMRAWVLLMKGEADRAQGNRDEARTQFDLARKVEPRTPVAWHATLRMAQTNFELREFAQALGDLAPLVGATTVPADLRAAALLLQGEAAYHAGDFAASATAFRRALMEFPGHPEAPAVRLATAWAVLRQGRRDEARREFLEFARVTPDNPHAADALVLASELAVATGDVEGARALIDRIMATYPKHPRTDFARLNRGILLVRAGDADAGAAAIRDWLGRAPFPPLFGRAHAALGVALLASGRHAEAQKEFALARREGLTAFGSLGVGSVALAEGRWNDAPKPLAEARDAGTPDVVKAAEYALAVVDFHRGKTREFKAPAQASLAAVRPGPRASERAGALLYVLTGIAVDEKDWPGALGFARRLVSEHPAHAAADDALERVGAGAAAAAAWPVAYESTTLLRQRYPQSPFAAAARVRLAQAQMETGRHDEARRELEAFATALAAGDPQAGTAWLTLARAREAGGDRPGALDAYARAARDGGSAQWSSATLFSHARLLAQEKRWDQARGVFERLLKSADTPAAAVEAAHGIGEAYAGAGDHLAAAEYYLTAAYVAPSTPWGRRGLLGAARALAALKQDEAAAITYRKLLDQPNVPTDLAQAARQGLSSLGK